MAKIYRLALITLSLLIDRLKTIIYSPFSQQTRPEARKRPDTFRFLR